MYGFIGNACKKYVENTTAMFETANVAHESNCGEYSIARGGAENVDFSQRLENDGYERGAGNSSNIVMEPNAYQNTMHKLITTDTEIAEELRQMSSQIKEMCSTIFIVPQTLTKYTAMLEEVDSSFEEFQSLTEQTATFGKSFSEEMMQIDSSF